MRLLLGIINISALLSVAAGDSVAFQVQPKARWGLKLDAPDDYMQVMAEEMAKLDTNYDYSFNKSPTSYADMPELVHAMEEVRKHMPTMQQEEKLEEVVVFPWLKDDNMRDMATEWDVLGTNYDYSFNSSPTDDRSRVSALKISFALYA